MKALQDWLKASALARFDLPQVMASPPTISWVGALSATSSAPTTIATGLNIAASNSLIAGPIRHHFTASLPGNPAIDGVPCLAVSRTYTCKGIERQVRSQNVIHVRTDAPVLELCGVAPDDLFTVQTLVVDGQLVPPVILPSSRGSGGGWNFGTIRIDFGSRALRDVWIETGLNLAYLRVDLGDRLQSIDESVEPQITVIGDSYLQSRSATFGNGGAIALELGARLGVHKIATDAIGGTGYYNSGKDLGNLNDRLAAHAADNSSVYLIMAGLNDYADVTDSQLLWPTRAAYEDSVSNYLKNLRASQPKSLIVVTAPFCPVPPMSDSSYVSHLPTNTSGYGDFLYKAQLHKTAVQNIAGPWVYIDTLMGGGWLNSSGATGDVTNLQWFTGGTPGAGTAATYKPGNTLGGGGGGFGGISGIPVLAGGRYVQAPEIRVSGGTGTGLLITAKLDASGAIASINIVQPGADYTNGSGLPALVIDAAFEITPAQLGEPQLIVATNPDGQYPLPAFAPPGALDLNNIDRLLMPDKTHPSSPGVEYLSRRLAQNIYDAVMVL